MNLLEPVWLWLLVGVAPLAGLSALTAWRNRRSVRAFFGSAGGGAWSVRANGARFALRSVLLVAAFAAISGALARPAHSPTPKPVQRPARDVVFVVDVSRSMLARDIRPNRLDRAKLIVADAMESVRGERVGLVAFAGSAAVKSPLTTDLGFARLTLESLSPESVSRGGTAIGDAIRAALELLDAGGAEGDRGASRRTDAYRDIILITDGEDHESEPLEAARAAADAGVRIIAIGLGSDLGGSTIPAEDGQRFQEYRGRPVNTRQDPEALRAIAEATPGGVFFNVGTGSIEMDRVYARLTRERALTQTDASPAVRWTESFQWLLGLALVCLCVEPLLAVRRRPRTGRRSQT